MSLPGSENSFILAIGGHLSEPIVRRSEGSSSVTAKVASNDDAVLVEETFEARLVPHTRPSIVVEDNHFVPSGAAEGACEASIEITSQSVPLVSFFGFAEGSCSGATRRVAAVRPDQAGILSVDLSTLLVPEYSDVKLMIASDSADDLNVTFEVQ